MRKIWRAVVLIALIALGALGAGCEWAPQNDTEPAEPATTEPATVTPKGDAALAGDCEKTLQDAQGREYATIKVNLPQSVYDGLADENAAASVAAVLQQVEDDFVALSEGDAAINYEITPDGESTFELTFSPFYAGDDYISLIADRYSDFSRAAHPSSGRYGYVFATADGAPLTLAQLLGADYAATVTAIVYQNLSEAGELDNYYENVEELLSLYLQEGQWYADGDTLYLIYEPDQIAPYVMGLQEFAIPLSLLTAD